MLRDRLKQLLEYDPETGIFRWRKLTDQRSRFAGLEAGNLNVNGYVNIKIDGRLYKAHRLAWLYMTGDESVSFVDHINMDRSDNRFCNLRAATKAQNGFNRRVYASNKSGFKGVTWHRNGWRATIKINGKATQLGKFSTPEEAHKAYVAAAIKHHGEFFNPDTVLEQRSAA